MSEKTPRKRDLLWMGVKRAPEMLLVGGVLLLWSPIIFMLGVSMVRREPQRPRRAD